MNKYRGSLIVTFFVAWLFVCAMGVIDPNAIAQTHEDLHLLDSGLDHEKVAAGDTYPTTNLAKLSQNTPTLLTGRVLDAKDRAIPRTVLTLTETDGTKHTTTSDSFGNFRFDEVLGEQQVVLSAEASQHSFSDLPVGMAGETVVSWRATTK